MDNPATNEALVHEIGSLIVHDEAYLEQPWNTLSLVATMRDENVVQLHGYVYLDAGKTAAETPRESKIAQRFVELHQVMRQRDGKPWKAALVQIWRETAKVSYFFEYDDAARWKVTPTNYEAMREELRPK
ncbi:hypothetical protein [Methylobacterium brachythecii]|uniref:Uncharacterized protein n=1 Tax=Methylobacterium brachythecii TaxID=1176177 RepID=A0A7W6AIF4_9HYPH|nr:hypothetical protein [Methylobacterium brachythecii]MBB3903313.1 hypothetical protein [Methylobacterium brachythecii]GLS46837.1 hypothetical protein GCM10007884_48340 [Methylobacterium brachythecii]